MAAVRMRGPSQYLNSSSLGGYAPASMQGPPSSLHCHHPSTPQRSTAVTFRRQGFSANKRMTSIHSGYVLDGVLSCGIAKAGLAGMSRPAGISNVRRLHHRQCHCWCFSPSAAAASAWWRQPLASHWRRSPQGQPLASQSTGTRMASNRAAVPALVGECASRHRDKAAGGPGRSKGWGLGVGLYGWQCCNAHGYPCSQLTSTN